MAAMYLVLNLLMTLESFFWGITDGIRGIRAKHLANMKTYLDTHG